MVRENVCACVRACVCVCVNERERVVGGMHVCMGGCLCLEFGGCYR